MRIATASISVSVVLVVSLINLQDRQPGKVIAESFSAVEVIIATPSPVPVAPTLVAIPTEEVRLTPWPTPDPLSGGGSLAFDYNKEGNSDIYLLPVGQTELVRLTSHAAVDREPAWSPDGQALAFASRRDGNWEIYVYEFARGRLRRITDDPAFQGNPSWSPDGQWLVYEAYQENNLDIYIIKADLSEGPYRLTENPALDFAPAWSPGGRHVAFTSGRNGNRDIFLLSLDEISDEAAVNVTRSLVAQDDDPTFSADGRTLAYSVKEAGLELIYALPLSEDYSVAGPAVSLEKQGRYPTWSPDGHSLIFAHSQGERHFLVASTLNAWVVAPQAYVGEGRLANPSWSAINLPPQVAGNLGSIDPTGEPRPIYVEAIASSTNEGDTTLLWELPVSAPSPFLSDRVDQSFQALRERIAAEAGWDFLGRLDGMFEPLASKPLPGQTSLSWNKAGRAFDLYYREALAFEPRIEVVGQVMDSGIYWRVYVRTAEQDGRQGEPLRDLPWDFSSRYGNEPQYYDRGGRLKEAIPTGYYVDFTALAADYGWSWVPSGEEWRTFFPAIRFWHYENRQGLTWEQAMRQIYTAEELESIP
jgi:TolB protein